MAKVTITIEDEPSGTVKVTANPSFSTMMSIDVSGHGLTRAHGYAMAALLRMVKLSEEKGSPIIKIPGIRV